jgi:hypothetical protein
MVGQGGAGEAGTSVQVGGNLSPLPVPAFTCITLCCPLSVVTFQDFIEIDKCPLCSFLRIDFP